MNKIRLLLLVFLIISIAGCTPKGCSFLPKASLTIIQYHLEKSVDEEGELTAQIEGVARNDSSAKLEYAEVIGKFYSQDGTLLATSVAKTTSEELPEDEEEKYFTLDPGQIWEFTITYSSDPREAHPSLNLLSWGLEKDSSGARIIGEAENNGDVMLSFAEIIGTFENYKGDTLVTATATTTRLGVGEIWRFTILCPYPDFWDVTRVVAEVNDEKIDYEPVPTQEVDHATVKVGTLRGSTVMP